MTTQELVCELRAAENELAKQWIEAFKGWPEEANRPNWREEYPAQYEAAVNAYRAAFEVTTPAREKYQSLCVEIERLDEEAKSLGGV